MSELFNVTGVPVNVSYFYMPLIATAIRCFVPGSISVEQLERVRAACPAWDQMALHMRAANPQLRSDAEARRLFNDYRNGDDQFYLARHHQM